VTNGAAIGYAILAAKAMGLTPKQISDLEGKMKVEMDFVTEDKAEEVYRKS
jgi:hypothetical protein